MAALVDRIEAKILELQAQIARVTANATAEVTRLNGHITTLTQAKNALTPTLEAKIEGLKEIGVL